LLKTSGSGLTYKQQVPIQTPYGLRVLDGADVTKNGKIVRGFELKTGKSPYKASQQTKDDWIRSNGVPVDLWRSVFR
jgi:hypothetical protein